MRKTGIYILLGITISLGIFVFAGVVYFRPTVQEVRIAEAAAAVETPAPPRPAPVASELPVPEEPEEAIDVAPVEMEPVEEPPVEEVMEPEPEPAPRVPQAPAVRMSVSMAPLAVEEPEIEEPEIVEIEEVEPVIDTEPIEEVVTEEIVEEVEVEPEEVMEAEPEPRVRIEPIDYGIPVRRIKDAPQGPTEVRTILPSITRPEPVEYIWTPTEIPEGPPVHVNPVSFNDEAFERRRIAVDDIFDKLIWE